jgi:RNA polymerase sigma-70 factor (ECF subfamily)
VTHAPPPPFAEIYDAFFDFVYRSVRRLGIPEESAEDVTQEVFVIVHSRLPAFEGRSSLKTWLFGIARNVCYRHRRRTWHLAAGGDEALERVADSGPTAIDFVARREAVDLLDALLERLDDERREVFILAELEEMAVPDVAEALGINVNTAYTRLRAARARFAELLARYDAHGGGTP